MPLFAPYRAGASLGYSLSDLGNVRNDPYTAPTYDDIIPDPSSIAILPLKLSLYANTMRSAWYGMGYMGSITNRFRPETLQRRYRSTTVNGMIGNMLRTTQGGLQRFVTGQSFKFEGLEEFGEMISPTFKKKPWSVSQGVWKELQPGETYKDPFKTRMNRWVGARRSAMNRQVDKPWGIIHSTEAETAYMQAGGKWSAGFLDRFYISPSSVESGLADLADNNVISHDTYYRLTENNLLQEEIAAEMYTGKRRITKAGTGKRDRIQKAIWGKYSPDEMVRGDYKRYYKSILRDRDTVSLWDIIKGEGPKRELGRWGELDRFVQRRASFFTGNNAVRFTHNMTGPRPFAMRFTFQWNKAAYGRVYGQAAEAALRTMQDQGINAASAAVHEAAHNIAATTVRRVRIAKMIRGVGMAAYGVPMIVNAALGAYKMVNEVVARAAPTVQMLTKMEFGGGEVLNNARTASERQRAMQAIQNAHMNARYLMGNEATMYH